MDIKEMIYDAANEKYPSCDYVYKRLEKEIKYFEESGFLNELEKIIELKNIIKIDNILITYAPFLSFYLLDLMIFNPLPAHYYDEKSKEVIFDENVLYAPDLEKREGYIRDGYYVDENYVLSRPIKTPMYIYTKNKELVLNYLNKNFDIIEKNSNYIDYKKSAPNMKKPSKYYLFGHFELFFRKDYELASDKNLFKAIDLEDFMNFLKGPFHKKKYYDTINEFGWKMCSVIGVNKIISKPNTFKDALYFALRANSNIDYNKLLSYDFDLRKFPASREDLYNYFINHGYDSKAAYDITYKLSLHNELYINIEDDDMKKFIDAIRYLSESYIAISDMITKYKFYKIDAENKIKEQNKVFDRQREKYDEFCEDGIVSGLDYIMSNYKICYILKETNSKTGFDLAKFVREGCCGATWNNISRWTAGLVFNKEFDDVKSISKDDRIKYLAPIAAINLKKTPGSASSNNKIISSFARDDKAYIIDELKVIDPETIICCGTGDIFIEEILDKKSSDFKKVKDNDDLFYYWHNEKLILKYRHPQWRRKTSEYLFDNLVPYAKDIIINKNTSLQEKI